MIHKASPKGSLDPSPSKKLRDLTYSIQRMPPGTFGEHKGSKTIQISENQ